MVELDVSLRAAQPHFDEGLTFARHLDTAAEGFFGFWLGRGFERTIADAYTKPGHDLSFEHVTFASIDDRIVGMASCYSAAQHRAASDEPLRNANGYRRVRAGIIAAVFHPIMRIIDTLEDGDCYLQAIAVDAESRGRGVGSVLFDAVEERARADGAARLCLDVSGGNAGAIRLYERRGMTVIMKSPRLFFAPRFRLLRMAKGVWSSPQRSPASTAAASTRRSTSSDVV
jgi:ribosomal protein S18 acetylase RimI-like enzyme